MVLKIFRERSLSLRSNLSSTKSPCSAVIVCYFISDSQLSATPFRSLDDGCSAGRSYRCAWCGRSCRLRTYATSEVRNGTNATSEEVLVHVEVDRCIDENSASNLNYSPFFTEALSIRTEAQSIKYSVLNPKRPTPARTASRTRSRETPDTDAPSPRRPRRAA